MKCKNHLLLCLFVGLMFHFSAWSQQLLGEWKIDYLLVDSARSEYSLSPIEVGKHHRYDYGNLFELLEDGSVRTWYTAPCGNDCFTTSVGRYFFQDEDHIQIFIDTITKHGHCQMTEVHKYPIDFGLFYVKRDGKKSIRLLRSNGDLEEDQLRMNYLDSIDQAIVQKGKFNGLLEAIRPDSALIANPENIVSVYLSSVEDKRCRVLYSKELGYNSSVVLIEREGRWGYLFCSSSLDEDRKVIYEVTYFD